MNKEEAIQSISQHYHPLPPDCQKDLLACCQLHRLEKGHLLVKEGQYADKTYYLLKGAARAFYLKDGKDITDWFAFEYEFISPIQSFFLNIASPQYIETLAPTLLLEVRREDVNRLSDLYRAFDRLGKIIVTQTLLKLQQRVISLQFESAQQKYDNLLAVTPDIEIRVPLMHIASYLGITLETLSRIRAAKIRI
ncbi:MAG: Crp/Fnr family transcriptional regulator [Saprospiraceae bacterium]|nr:Crp/Fnr family transcriptional regulator [Saprospiraceae bacterium]